MSYTRDDKDVQDWRTGVERTEDGPRLALSLSGVSGRALSLHLTAQQAILLAQHLFTNALRMSAGSENGRLAAGVAARLMIRQTQDVAREVNRKRERRERAKA